MKLAEALYEALEDEKTHTDPFLLYSCVSDLVGNDIEEKEAAKKFFQIDTNHGVTETILAAKTREEKKKASASNLKIRLSEKAYVYRTTEHLLHVSLYCPMLKGRGAAKIPYDLARTWSAINAGVDWDKQKDHIPDFCPVCKDFTPTYPRGLWEKLSVSLYMKHGWGCPVKYVKP